MTWPSYVSLMTISVGYQRIGLPGDVWLFLFAARICGRRTATAYLRAYHSFTINQRHPMKCYEIVTRDTSIYPFYKLNRVMIALEAAIRV